MEFCEFTGIPEYRGYVMLVYCIFKVNFPRFPIIELEMNFKVTHIFCVFEIDTFHSMPPFRPKG